MLMDGDDARELPRMRRLLPAWPNQTRLKNFRNHPIYKYGVQVPCTHEEAVWLDEKSNTNHWNEAEQLEIKQLFH